MLTLYENCFYTIQPKVIFKLIWDSNHSYKYIVVSDEMSFCLSGVIAKIFRIISSPKSYQFSENLLHQFSISKHRFWNELFNLISEGLVIKLSLFEDTTSLRLSRGTFILNISSQWVIGNSNYCTIDYIEYGVAKLLMNGKINQLPEMTIEDLCSRGYLISQTNLLLNKHKQIVTNNYFVLSYKCNLKCSYCFEEQLNHRCIDMSESTLDLLLKKCEMDPNRQNIILYGGEPLLPSLTPKILKLINYVAAKNNCYCRVISNGVNASKMLPLFEGIKDKLLSFTITLDGNPRIHDSRRMLRSGEGTYEAIIKSINDITIWGVLCIVRINVALENVDALDLLVDQLNSLPAKDRISIFLARIEDPLNEAFFPVSVNELVDVYKKIRSMTDISIVSDVPILRFIIQSDMAKNGTLHFFESQDNYCNTSSINVFDTDGSVYCCNEAMGDSFFKAEYRRDLNERHVEQEVMPHMCMDCMMYPLCLGNCPRINRCYALRGHERCEKSDIMKAVRNYCQNNSTLGFIKLH